MKNSTQRNIKWLSIAILVIATVNVVFIYGVTISQLWIQKAVVWNQDKLAWQIFIIAGRLVGAALLYVFCWIFLVRTNRSLKNGEIFPRSNVALIRWTALVSILVTFVRSNYDDVLQGAHSSVLDGNTFFIPLVILLFAGLYKMAYLTAKDSSLAI
ncbi:MAG: hypothetical protein IKW89_12000 [Bacteroidales bacterium]|nr:hypothetical protein [Bacteroidales bacterium]